MSYLLYYLTFLHARSLMKGENPKEINGGGKAKEIRGGGNGPSPALSGQQMLWLWTHGCLVATAWDMGMGMGRSFCLPSLFSVSLFSPASPSLALFTSTGASTSPLKEEEKKMRSTRAPRGGYKQLLTGLPCLWQSSVAPQHAYTASVSSELGAFLRCQAAATQIKQSASFTLHFSLYWCTSHRFCYCCLCQGTRTRLLIGGILSAVRGGSAVTAINRLCSRPALRVFRKSHYFTQGSEYVFSNERILRQGQMWGRVKGKVRGSLCKGSGVGRQCHSRVLGALNTYFSRDDGC